LAVWRAQGADVPRPDPVDRGRTRQALDRLEPLLKIPDGLAPGWLRIDPTFAPLRGNPRFEKFAPAVELADVGTAGHNSQWPPTRLVVQGSGGRLL